MAQPAPGVMLTLEELLDMRHRLRDVRLFSSPNGRSPLLGFHRSRLRGLGVEFDQVRLYQAGDDIRSIDWRVTARMQEPYTKLFQEERERPVYILIEQSKRLFLGSALCFKSVLAARTAALIGWAALAHGDRIGGQVFGDDDCHEVRPRHDQQSLMQLFNLILQANHRLPLPSERPSQELIGPALRRVRKVLRPNSLLLVICDERTLNSVAEQQLILIGQHCDVVLLPVYDPLDHAFPASGILRFNQNGQTLQLDTRDRALRRAYRAQGEHRQERWSRLAQRLRIPLLPLSTESDPVSQLHDRLTQHRSGYSS